MSANLSPRKKKDTSLPSKQTQRGDSPRQLVPEEDRIEQNAALLAEAYNKVAKLAKLQLIRLTKANFSMQREFVARRDDAENKETFSYGSSIQNMEYFESTGVATCEWVWKVTGKIGKKTALSIEATYYVLYDELLDCDPEAVARYVRRVARFATYPYFRAHVSQVSWGSGADLPILPTIST